MNCHEFEARLDPYVDGELGVAGQAAASAHLADCAGCAEVVRHERAFRQLLRRQPGEPAPDLLRARLAGRARRRARRGTLLPWVASLVAGVLVVSVVTGQQQPLVADLVDTHIAFAQVTRPAEVRSQDPVELATWFLERSGLRVDVPDYSRAGIALIGGRRIDARGRRAAYLLYGKGYTLLSVFVVPLAAEEPQAGRAVRSRGAEYTVGDRKGYRTVTWIEDRTLFSLVSMLDYEALLECADRLRQGQVRRLALPA